MSAVNDWRASARLPTLLTACPIQQEPKASPVNAAATALIRLFPGKSMPVRNFLKAEAKAKLQQVLKEHEHPAMWKRALVFLLLNDGHTQAQTAALIGCSLRKIAY